MIVVGDKAEIARLKSAPAVISEELYAATAESALLLEAGAKALIAPHSKTGLLALATGHFIDKVPLGFEAGIQVSEIAPYGEPADKGTGLFGPNHRPFVGHFRLPPGFNYAYPQGLEGTYPPWGFGGDPPGSGIPLAPGHPHPGMEGIHFTTGSLKANEVTIRERYALAGKKIAAKLSGGPL
jgi:hypothetical protein